MKSHRLSSIVACSAALLNAVATRSAHAHAGHGHGSSAADAVLHWFADMSHLSAIGLMFAGVAMVVFTLRIVWRRANE